MPIISLNYSFSYVYTKVCPLCTQTTSVRPVVKEDLQVSEHYLERILNISALVSFFCGV